MVERVPRPRRKGVADHDALGIAAAVLVGSVYSREAYRHGSAGNEVPVLGPLLVPKAGIGESKQQTGTEEGAARGLWNWIRSGAIDIEYVEAGRRRERRTIDEIIPCANLGLGNEHIGNSVHRRKGGKTVAPT